MDVEVDTGGKRAIDFAKAGRVAASDELAMEQSTGAVIDDEAAVP
jgi:hypothetical protein